MTHLLGHTRKFNGLRYKASQVKKLKSDAKNLAKNIRKRGMKARVTKAKCETGGNEYYIFTRRT